MIKGNFDYGCPLMVDEDMIRLLKEELASWERLSDEALEEFEKSISEVL